MHSFPAEVPFDCLREIVSIVNSGVGDRKGELIQHVGYAVGSVGAIVSQWEGIEAPETFGELECNNLEDCVCRLETATSGDGEPKAFGANPLMQALLLKLLELLTEKLKEILEDLL